MKSTTLPTRIACVLLTGLLALPMAQSDFSVEAKRRPRTVTRTFRNAEPIPIPLAAAYPASAALYPSPILVGGAKGVIRDVNVRLTGISHDDPEEIQVLLVGPGGRTAVVVADVGGEEPVAEVTLRLDDEATEPLADAMLASGAYRPTNEAGGAIAFNAPAPAVTSGNAALSVFDGTRASGTWRLFVQDDAEPSEAGVVAGGWEIEITTKVKGKKRR